MKSVPYTSLLESLHYTLHVNTTSTEYLLSGTLLTDGGLALVAQFVHRSYCLHQLQDDPLRDSSAKDRFVSVSTTSTASATAGNSSSNGEHETVSETDCNREDALTLSLLGLLPALLDRIELSRTSSISKQRQQQSSSSSTAHSSRSTAEVDDHMRDRSATTPPSVASPLEGCMGEELDRQGCKILALNIFMLLETHIAQLSLNSQSVLLEQLHVQYTKYEAQSQLTQSAGVAVPLAAVAVLEGESPPLRTQCSQLATVYDCLEKRLLQQHDCMLVSAGMRCLYELLHQCSSSTYNTDTTSTTAVVARCSSIAWTAMRNIYTESIYLSVHLQLPLLETDYSNNTTTHDIIPGMDENWSQLVKSVSSQQFSIQKIIFEIEAQSTKKTNNVLKLLLTCFHTKKDFQSYKSMVSMHDQMAYIAAYRQYWACWWATEVSSERVYGVAVLVREIFKLFLHENYHKNNKKNSTNSSKNKLLKKNKRKKSTNYNNTTSSDSDNSSSNEDEEFNKNKRNNSLNNTKKSKSMAAEHILNKDYITNTTNKMNIFPFLTENTLEFHISITLPLFPALFLLSKPNKNVIHSSSNNTNTNNTTSYKNNINKKELDLSTTAAGPYTNFTHISMLFIWLIQHFHSILIDKHEHLQLLIRIASNFMKIVRTMLPVIELTINRMILWRNEQTLALNDNSFSSHNHHNKVHNTSNNNSSSSNSNSNNTTKHQQQQQESVDIGSIEYLQCMLNWAYKVVRSITEFIELFEQVIIQPGNIAVASGLRRELPGLSRLSEQLLGRIASTAKAHSLKLSAALPSAYVLSSATGGGSSSGNSATDLPRIGDKAMYVCMTEFLTRHHATVLAPLDPVHLQEALNSTAQQGAVHGSSDPTSNSSSWAPQSHFQHQNQQQGTVEDSSEDSDYEFAAITSKRPVTIGRGSSSSTAAAVGWGLYTTNAVLDEGEAGDIEEGDGDYNSESHSASAGTGEEGGSTVDNSSSIYEDSASQFDSEFDEEFDEEYDDIHNTTNATATNNNAGDIDFDQYEWDSDGMNDDLDIV